MYKYKGDTTEEAIDCACKDLAESLKKLFKFDGNCTWDHIHLIGRLIDDARMYLMLYGALDEEES